MDKKEFKEMVDYPGFLICAIFKICWNLMAWVRSCLLYLFSDKTLYQIYQDEKL